jgi:hypothetical protein
MEEMLVHLPAEVRDNQEQMTTKMKTNQEKLEVRMKASHKKREINQKKMVAKIVLYLKDGPGLIQPLHCDL